jgi:hypothetical protein
MVDDPDLRTCLSRYVGVIPIPVGFFFKEPEARP